MNKEMKKKIIEEVERKEGVEQPIQTMNFSYYDLIYYLEYYETKIYQKLRKTLRN